MKLSVCVASRGDALQLAEFFSAMRRLVVTFPWELIVVINSPCNTELSGLRAQMLDLPVVLEHEPRPGKGNALNKALRVAEGELLVFTDDDAHPREDWLIELVKAAETNPWAGILGGRITAVGEIPDWIRNSSNLQGMLTTEHDLGDQTRPYPPDMYPYGPNMAVRRSVVDACHMTWLSEFGPGTAIPLGDETGFLSQASPPTATNRLYVPSAVMEHHVNPSYFSFSVAVLRCYRGGIAAGKLGQKINNSKYPSIGRRVWERAMGLRSARELVCVIVRAAGVLIGRLDFPPKDLQICEVD